ncbi:ABC transporter substrate-binding protein [Candidatus Saccharibacteria bacterium]|nr:ABC transporter substrate-binding protein [Candidatus Saccharibacteria bacterium]
MSNKPEKEKPTALERLNASKTKFQNIKNVNVSKSSGKLTKTARRKFNRASRLSLKHTRKFLFSRWNNLRLARRHVMIWLLLITVLIMTTTAQSLLATRELQTSSAVNGGVVAEGVVDKIVTINPLFAATDSEKAASRLVYSSLLTYDETNRLHGDLATTWSISEDGRNWSVKLRDNAIWSDGQKLTADDVVFTVGLIKNSSVGSPLFNGWRTIEIAKVNDREVKFTLSNTYMSFPFALTFGILPQHIFEGVKPADLKNLTTLDTGKIIGSGPFVFKARETLTSDQEVWRFAPSDRYYDQRPRIASLTIRTYTSEENLMNGLKRGEINSAVGLSTRTAAQQLGRDQRLIQAPLADGVFVLFNNSTGPTSDKIIREVLRLGTDRASLRKNAANSSTLNVPEALETPMSPGIFASVDELKQPDFEEAKAAEQLEGAGWVMNADKLREKDGQVIALDVVTIKGADYEPVAKALVDQWRRLGIDAQLTSADPATAQQNYLMPRSYDVLVYQLHLGVDPDEFAYWSSSQALATGLNFANYKSTRADLILSNARMQTNAAAREARYVDFVKLWLSDAPAIALYRPNFNYIISGQQLDTLDDSPLISASYRFHNVTTWTARVDDVMVTP